MDCSVGSSVHNWIILLKIQILVFIQMNNFKSVIHFLSYIRHIPHVVNHIYSFVPPYWCIWLFTLQRLYLVQSDESSCFISSVILFVTRLVSFVTLGSSDCVICNFEVAFLLSWLFGLQSYVGRFGFVSFPPLCLIIS